ncbi:MAG: DUF2029 domain-containing protein [Chloroflexi bacterium]|nr:DUF2029 domain-containing protein [Chloroflexota bacterium]
MKKIALGLLATGVLFVGVFTLGDLVGFGDDDRLGAAQLLGIEVGIVLLLLGIGFLRIDWNGEWKIGKRIGEVWRRLLNMPPTVYVVSTFLVLYVALFIFPVFFSKSTIQYFNKYIPNAWVTRIGFDVEQTVSHIETWLKDGQSPYADGIVPYPPLALAVFAPFVVLGYPAYYKLLSMITVVSFFLAAFLIPILLNRKKEFILPLLFFVTGLYSYGFQFELERGQFNVIAFACCLSAIYLFHYHPKFRYFAYLLFSLSIQLKVYPVIFTVMFIRDWRDWKGNLRRIAGLGIINFSLLFVLGYQLFAEFTANLLTRQSGFLSSRTEDISISGFVYQLTTDGFGLIPANALSGLAQYAGLITTILLLIFVACMMAVIVHAYFKRQEGLNIYLLTICTIGALTLPAGSFDYKLAILAAPMALLFGSPPAQSSSSRKIILLITTLFASVAYWSTLYPFTVKSSIFVKNFPALFIILISVTILYFLAQGQTAVDLSRTISLPGAAGEDLEKKPA